MENSLQLETRSQDLKRLFYRHLVKTIFRTAIWLGAAALITHFYPDARWQWYVAFTFIVVALAFSLFVLLAASFSARQETQHASKQSGPRDDQVLGKITTVYRLREQAKHIREVQEATLNTKEFGFQQTHGLFGSKTWWQKIATGELPLQTAEGHITRVFMGSMNDWPEFVMRCADGTERRHTREVNRPGLDQYYRVGAYVEVDYVIQHFKVAGISKGSAHELVVEIRIADEA